MGNPGASQGGGRGPGWGWGEAESQGLEKGKEAGDRDERRGEPVCRGASLELAGPSVGTAHVDSSAHGEAGRPGRPSPAWHMHLPPELCSFSP